MQWQTDSVERILTTKPFTVEKLELTNKATGVKTKHPYHRLVAPNWVNILPVTQEKEIVLIKQTRVGPMSDVIEIPGGVIDPGEQPDVAARRELEEETGDLAPCLEALGSINPNPAIMTNELFMFIALDCAINPERQHFPDDNESIEIIRVKPSELRELVEGNLLGSALAALTVLKARAYWDSESH